MFRETRATTVVVLYTLQRAGESGDKPDPVTEARIEEEHAEARRQRPVRRRGRDREVFE